MKIEKIFNDKKIILLQGDITDIEADAIVNSANNQLWMCSSVAGAIKEKGGVEIEKEAIAKGPIEVGQAIETTAGKLKARYVIHTAVMGQDLKTNEGYIRKATLNSLKTAEELKLNSIAFPALGTGVGGFPMDKCAEVMIDVVKKYLKSAELVKEITFVLFDDKTFYAFWDEIDMVELRIKDLGFVDNFIHFNIFYRNTIIDRLWRQFEQGQKGDKLAFSLEIYSTLLAMSEDVGRIMMALLKKKDKPEKPLFYYYCKDFDEKYWGKLYEILKTDNLDELLININLPRIKELENVPNYSRLLKKEDYFREQIDKALRCLSRILVLREPKLFREAYNSIKHGMKLIAWCDKEEFFLIRKATNIDNSETLARGPVFKLTKKVIKTHVEEAKNIELSLGVMDCALPVGMILVDF